MKEFIGRVEESIKSFVAEINDKSSIIIIVLLCIQIILTCIAIKFGLEAYIHIINKVENRYRCSIEAVKTVSGVDLDYFSGEIKEDLSADVEIQRKCNHRKYLYHYIKDWF